MSPVDERQWTRCCHREDLVGLIHEVETQPSSYVIPDNLPNVLVVSDDRPHSREMLIAERNPQGEGGRE